MRISILGFVFAASLTPFAAAQDKGPDLSTSFSVDYTTHYYYRGILQEHDDLIIQPSLEVTGNVAKDLGFTVGMWNSLHEGASGREGGQTAWYESDIYASLDYAVEDVTVSLSYTVLTSPNGQFVTTQELGLQVSWNDSERYKDSKFGGFAPHVLLVKEVSGGSDLGNTLGKYLELGIEASFEATDEITLAVPLTVGINAGDYYEDGTGNDSGGYWSIGVSASMPVSYWELAAGVQYLSLDGFTETANKNADSSEVIATVGMSVSW